MIALLAMFHNILWSCCNVPIILFTMFIDFALEIFSNLLWRTIKAPSVNHPLHSHSSAHNGTQNMLHICFHPSTRPYDKKEVFIFLNGFLFVLQPLELVLKVHCF